VGFVSYAQNFEDVMLWRALKHIENGYYIDVGANDPSIESVTRAFYDRGWHGINVEPLPLHHADLVRERPRDINLQCAAGAINGEIEVWDFEVRGWATAAPNVVAQHEANGHVGTFHRVPVLPLTDICARHVTGEIHFLKIDVEGLEKSVLDGMDFSRFRPWILVIEATRPNSTEEIYAEWESDVLAANYVHAYSDGLNRFYVAKEHSELLITLRYPPNVFDQVIRSDQVNSAMRTEAAERQAREFEERTIFAEAQAQQVGAFVTSAEAKALQAEERAGAAETALIASEGRASATEAALIAVYNSWSWRITAPLRVASRSVKVKCQFLEDIRPKAKTKIRNFVAHVALYVSRRPKLRLIALAALEAFPKVKARLKAIAPNGTVGKDALEPAAARQDDLTPLGRQNYQALKDAIERRKKKPC
jgi:FkbM family methyltransferase